MTCSLYSNINTLKYYSTALSSYALVSILLCAHITEAPFTKKQLLQYSCKSYVDQQRTAEKQS